MSADDGAYDRADTGYIYIYDRAVKNRLGKRKKSGGGIPWTERVRQILDVPLEGISNMSTVQIVGEREVSVTGCRCVLEYSTEQIVLRGHSGCIRICGRNLEMESLIGDRITVCGCVGAVYTDFSREE